MKRLSKIFLLFITIFSVLILVGADDVFAFANQYVAWRKDVDGDKKPDLLFRRYTTATEAQLDEYYKAKSGGYLTNDEGTSYYAYTYKGTLAPSKWVYTENAGIKKPSAKEFTTIGYSFHTAQAGRYSVTAEGTTTAAMISYNEEGIVTPITNTISNVLTYFNRVESNILRPVIITDEEYEAMSSDKKEAYNAIMPSMIYEIYSNNGGIFRHDLGTRWNISTIQPENKLVYRYAIMEIVRMNDGEYLPVREAQANSSNIYSEEGVEDREYVYIEDRVIYHDELLKLRQAMDDNGIESSMYVSDIVISEALYGDGGYELSRTASQFFSQYKKYGYTTEFWPQNIIGTAEEATQTAMNLFDNAITMPKKSKRNVIVRHISIGNNTKVNDSTLASATYLPANNPSMQVKDDISAEYTNVDANGRFVFLTGAWEVYAGNIDVYQYMKKSANSYTDGHVAIGYNVATGSSLEDAAESLSIKLNWGSYSEMFGNNAVEIDGLIPESESEWVVIDFYYSQKPDIVYVNHLLVDKNNKVLDLDQQIIEGNYFAYTGPLYALPIAAASPRYNSLESNETVINRIQEQYYRQEGQSILARTSLSILDERLRLIKIFEGIKYVGYQLYDKYVPFANLVGTKVDPEKEWYKPFDVVLGVVVPPNKTQVNFYYYNYDKNEAAIPDKFLSTEYLFKAENDNEDGNCYNENGKEIISVPSGIKAKAGIVNLYHVMASAINLKYIPASQNKQNVDVKLKYILGGKSVVLRANNVKYSFSYFRVDEMVVDALTDVILYDANPKWSSTSGGAIFGGNLAWSGSKLTKHWDNATKLKLTALGKEIPNDDYDKISDWKSYAAVQVEDKNGNKSEWHPTDVYIESTLLTKEQVKSVDANGDGKINQKDITYATKELNDRLTTLNKAIAKEQSKIDVYNEKLQQYLKACEEYEAALAETSVLQDLLRDAEAALQAANNAVDAAKAAIETQKDNIDTYKANIKNLEEIIDTLKGQIKTLKETTIPAAQRELKALKEEKSGYESTKSTKESEKAQKEALLAIENAKLTTLIEEYWALYNNTAELDNNIETATNAVNTALENVQANCPVNEGDPITLACTDAQTALEEAEALKEYWENAKNKNSNAMVAKLGEITPQSQIVNGIDSDISTLKTVIGNLETNIATAQTNIEKQEALIAEHNASVTAKEESIVTNQASIETNKSNIIAAENMINYIQNTEIPNLLAIVKQKEDAVEAANGKLDLKKEATAAFALAKKAACWLEVEVRQAAYDAAKKALEKAQNSYDEYKEYKDTLDANYDEYQALYEEFVAIDSRVGVFKGIKQALDYLDVKITFKVSNMLVNLNNENLNDPNKLEAKTTLKLTEAMEQTTKLETPEPVFKKSAYNGIGTKITENDYNFYSISKYVKNGLRTIAAEAKYETRVLIKKKTLFYKSTAKSVVDNLYYSNYVDKKESITNGEFQLDYDGLIGKTSRDVNIYTPIFVNAQFKSVTDKMLDQTTSSYSTKSNVQTIQLGVPFEVKFENKRDSADRVYGITDAAKYKEGYYIKFDFDVCNVKVYRNGSVAGWIDSNGTARTGAAKNQVIKAGTWIGIIYSGSNTTKITAEPYSDVKDQNIKVTEEERQSYTVRAVAYNASSVLARDYALRFETLLDMMQHRSIVKDTVKNICTDTTTTGEAVDMPSYFAERTYELVVLNRLYDFRITDIKDVAWKSVFRETKNSAVNAHTGNLYYSGNKKWSLADGALTETMIRSASEIGRNPTRILPLGPYKHTDQTYIKAPKLGYTFSYDMKVTGVYYNSEGEPLTDKKVRINTKFYYVSNDGKIFYEEYKPGTKGIYLFYKNASGKYVRIDDNGGGYELSFIPNDPYRYIETSEKIMLSKDKEVLGNLRRLVLTHEMATVYHSYGTTSSANNGTIITYYGEYKLPNSTIAVYVEENGVYDINKPLKNGYIGVIFDITAIAGKDNDGNEISLSYSKNTKSATNTSQWDYEGYLGFNKPRFGASVAIRLEEGKWNINNDLYNKIKGTVILYDVDEKAATDFE